MIPDPNDTLGDPVVERTMQQLVEAAGRLVANRSVPGSGAIGPYGTIDDTGRVKLSSDVLKKTGAATVTKSAKTSVGKKNGGADEKNVATYRRTIQLKTASKESQIRTCEHVSIDQPVVQQ